MDSDEEVFEDALEDVSPAKEKVSKRLPLLRKKGRDHLEQDVLPLGEALESAKEAIDMFLNNNFNEARSIVQPLADKSIYHALGYGVFMYLKAVMTFEQKHIEEASTVLTRACDTINQFRKKSNGLVDSLGKMLRKPDYDSYTELEIHAELCFAETLLLKAVLTLYEDETLVSFVKAGLKVRTCYQSFRDCWTILQERSWNEDQDKYKADFESGVRMGVGSFNLLISLLPARIMKLLEFIGFGGNKEAGMKELNRVYEEKCGLRQFLACLILLGYHLVLSFFLGQTQCNLELCKEILDTKLEQYPNGAFFLFFKGRFHFIKGEMNEAIEWYKKSCNSQQEWPQFHHVCYWELVWANQYSRNWWGALKYASMLLEDSKWSKCFYAYQKAVLMCMVQGELNPEQLEEQRELMKNVPKWKQRIAGKSLPMEKFAVRKADRFLTQGNFLVVPALELIYVWNGFKILGNSWSLVEPIFVLVEQVYAQTQAEKSKRMFFLEDICLLTLLKGMCLKHMNSPLQAEECFKIVISHHGKLKRDIYLIPYAQFELANLMRSQGNITEALALMEKTKNDYKDYMLQSRLHFRIHAAQSEISANMKAEKIGEDLEDVLPLEQPNNGTLSEEEAIKMIETR